MITWSLDKIMIYQTGFVSYINRYLKAYKSVNYDAFGLVEDV